MLSLSAAAAKTGLSVPVIRKLCLKGIIPHAVVRRGKSHAFAVPESALPFLRALAEAHRHWKQERERIVNELRKVVQNRSETRDG